VKFARRTDFRGMGRLRRPTGRGKMPQTKAATGRLPEGPSYTIFRPGASFRCGHRSKNKAAAGIFRGGNFFVRANDVSGFFGEFGCNQLDGFHFHFSRVLPLASSRFFRIWIRMLLHGSDGFALGFSGHRLTSFQWMIGFKRAFRI
jgi:hypothetical protein